MRSRLYAIISIPIFAILYCFTAIVVLIILIFAWLNMKSPIIFLSQLWAKSIFLIIGKKFRVYGKENIKKDEKYILVANHASLFDIVAIMSMPGLCSQKEADMLPNYQKHTLRRDSAILLVSGAMGLLMKSRDL